MPILLFLFLLHRDLNPQSATFEEHATYYTTDVVWKTSVRSKHCLCVFMITVHCDDNLKKYIPHRQ